MEKLVFKGMNDQPMTNSLLVAKTFGKEHKSVLETIRNILVSAEKSSETDNQCVIDMFTLSYYDAPLNNGTNATRRVPMYIMNRDGFSLLAMGFTGKKAMNFKIMFINEFNRMEELLKNNPSDKLSQLEILAKSAQALVDHEKRLSTVESEIGKINERFDNLEKERNESGEELLAISISTAPIPELSLRDQIRQLVNRYSAATNTSQADVWSRIYHDLYYSFHISINSYKRKKGQTLLDVAEKNNILKPIFDIISKIVSDFQTESKGNERIRTK